MCNFHIKMIYTDKKYKSELEGRRNEMLGCGIKSNGLRNESGDLRVNERGSRAEG